MPVVPVRGIGRRGIAPDQAPYDLTTDYIWIGHNMRIRQGSIGAAPGYNRHVIPDTGDGAIDGSATSLAPKRIGGWTTGGTQAWLMSATDDLGAHRLYTYDGNSLLNVSPGGLTVPVDDWTFQQMGPRLIAHAPTEKPLYLNSVVGQFQELSGWDTRPGGDGWRCDNLVAFGSFLIAAPITDAGQDRYSSIAWSDEMPPDIDSGEVNWDYTDPTGLAGENVLDQQAGRILAMHPLGQQLMIYCEFGVWAMSFVGGPLVFNFRPVFTDDGVLNSDGVAVVDDNRHAVIGRHNIYIHDGNTKQFIADGRTRYFFYQSLQDQAVCMAHSELVRDDIMFCYNTDPAEVDPNNKTYDRALIYNWRYDCWTTQDLPMISDMANVPVPPGFDAWDAIPEQWDQSLDAWGVGVAAGTLLPIWVSGPNKLVYKDLFGRQFDGVRIPWRLRMEQMDMDQLLAAIGEQPTTDRWKYVRKLWPQISGVGTICVGIDAYQTYQPGIDYDINVTPIPICGNFVIGEDYKFDLEAHGRYITLELTPSSSGEDDVARIVGTDIDIKTRTFRQ